MLDENGNEKAAPAYDFDYYEYGFLLVFTKLNVFTQTDDVWILNESYDSKSHTKQYKTDENQQNVKIGHISINGPPIKCPLRFD